MIDALSIRERRHYTWGALATTSNIRKCVTTQTIVCVDGMTIVDVFFDVAVILLWFGQKDTRVLFRTDEEKHQTKQDVFIAVKHESKDDL
jgi:hypothetical protein